MMRKVLIALLAALLIAASQHYAAAQTTNIQPLKKSKARASQAMKNVLFGPGGIPSDIRETDEAENRSDISKQSARSGTVIDKSLAKLFGGVWQIATFWYVDEHSLSQPESGRGSSASSRASR